MSKPWGGIEADAKRAEAEERENLAKNPHLAAVSPESLPSLKESLTPDEPGGGGRVGRGDGSYGSGGGGPHGGFVDDGSPVSLYQDSNLPSRAGDRLNDALKTNMPNLFGAASSTETKKIQVLGDAKPREVVLEKGRKIDFEFQHRRSLDDEVRFGQKPSEKPEAGRSLEILPSQLALIDELSSMKHADTPQSHEDRCSAREFRFFSGKDDRSLDDEVRFGQKPSERPGAGRSLEILPSQLALLDEFSNMKHADTPQSHDDRCSAREFRFFSSKDDRSLDDEVRFGQKPSERPGVGRSLEILPSQLALLDEFADTPHSRDYRCSAREFRFFSSRDDSLDDEVRFGQKPSERPGAGRSLEIFPSQLALIDEFSNMKHADTPQSHENRCSAREFRFFSGKDDRSLDDEVRFGQKPSERPGAGRSLEILPSQLALIDEFSNMKHADASQSQAKITGKMMT